MDAEWVLKGAFCPSVRGMGRSRAPGSVSGRLAVERSNSAVREAISLDTWRMNNASRAGWTGTACGKVHWHD